MSNFRHTHQIYSFTKSSANRISQVDVGVSFTLKEEEIHQLNSLSAHAYEKFLNTLTSKIVPITESSKSAVQVSFKPIDNIVSVSFDFPFDDRLVSPNDKFKHLVDLLCTAPKSSSEASQPSAVMNVQDSNPLLGRRLYITCDILTTELSETQVYMMWAMRNNRIVIVAGAGVSLSLTGNKNSLWWPFMDGVWKAVWPEASGNGGKVNFDLNRWNSLDSHSASEYMYYCAHLDNRLEALNAAMFSLLRQLEPKDSPSLTDTWQRVLRPFKGAMVTFNYDEVLEIALGRTPVDGIVDSTRVVNMCRENQGLQNHIIHAHGLFSNHRAKILQQSTYIDAAKFVPELFCALSQQGYIFIHAGMGGGFTDPDMVPYWVWENTKHQVGQRIVTNHYVMVKNGDQKKLSLPTFGGIPASFISQVEYDNYDDLPTALGSFLDGSFFGVP